MTRDQAIQLAREHAQRSIEGHSYLPAGQAHGWMPHEWVIAALMEAGAVLPRREPVTVPEAMKVVTDALKSDPEYAWSWHCNITMAQVDEGNDQAIAEHGSMRFLGLLCGETLEPAHPLRPKPSARKPMSDDDMKTVIGMALDGTVANVMRLPPGWRAVIRAVERHHRIGVVEEGGIEVVLSPAAMAEA